MTNDMSPISLQKHDRFGMNNNIVPFVGVKMRMKLRIPGNRNVIISVFYYLKAQFLLKLIDQKKM